MKQVMNCTLMIVCMALCMIVFLSLFGYVYYTVVLNVSFCMSVLFL